MPFVRPGRSSYGTVPLVLGSVLLAQNENGATSTSPATNTHTGLAAANYTILAWSGILTANAGAPTANNGNSYTSVFAQAFPSPYTAYSIRGYRSYSVLGGSDHTVTITKTGGAADQELSLASLILSGGTIVSSAVTQQDNAGEGHTFVSGSVTATGPALLVAIASGDGDPSAVAPSQTWPGNWTVLQSVARNTSQDDDGHIPFYLAVRTVTQAGSYSVSVQTTIDEGLIQAIYAVQL